MNIIEAHINYEIDNNLLFDNINLSVTQGEFVSVIGENGVGKTTLLKLLGGLLITNNQIKIDNLQVNKYNIEEVNKRVSFITSYNEFFSKTVIEEILETKRDNQFEVNKARKLLDNFNLLYLEKMSPLDLSYAENQIVALIKAIVKESKIIILDNAFIRLDIDKRKELYDYIKDYSKKNDITILMTTTNIYDLKYSSRIIVIKNKEIFFNGSYNKFLDKVDINKIGFKNSWENEISDKLIMYDLINDIHDNIDDIVGELCE
jgi:ABC-type cobalamin/Fe3+-siderophores transport system ATPase subunit